KNILPEKQLRISTLITNILRIKKAIQEIEIEIEKIEKQIAAYTQSPDEWLNKFEQYNNCIHDLQRIERSIEETRKNISDANDSIDYYTRQLNSKRNPKVKLVQKQIDIAKKIKDITKEIINDLNASIIQNVQKTTSNYWLELIQDPHLWDEIIIRIDETSGDWRIEPLKKGMSYAPNLSQGQRHVLGTSFMTTLVSIFNIKYPLVFDSPFGKLDDIVDEKIGTNLPNWIKGQIILFVTSKEHRSIKDSIRGSVGKAYKIIATDDKNISKINEFQIT
ncbi:MAG: hypothetical protein ACTSUL_02200, partial [Promethearchaeota archaeon]